MATIEYRVDGVRSRELETGLFSNADSLSKVVDTAALKLPSSSPLKRTTTIFIIETKNLSLDEVAT